MFQNLLFSISKVLPLFIIMFLGYYGKKKSFITDFGVKEMNNIVFNIALPVTLFKSVALSDFKQDFNIYAILALMLSFFIIYIISWTLGEILIKDKYRIGGFVQGAFRSNYTIIGLALVANVLGTKGQAIGASTMPIVIPFVNILAIIVLTVRGAKENKLEAKAFKNIFINIIKNPLIIGVLLGIPFSIFEIHMPDVALTTLNLIGNVATPLALIAIGATLNFNKLKETLNLSILLTLLKNMLCPLVGAFFCILFKLDGMTTLVVCMLLGAPTAVSSYVLTENMGSDGELVANTIVVSTLFSIVSYTIMVYIAKTLMWI